jgi:hypothetical protein
VPSPTAKHFLEDHGRSRPWKKTDGAPAAFETDRILFGNGDNALEVAIASATRPGQPKAGDLRALFKTIQANRPAPRLLVVTYIGPGDQPLAAVVGTIGDPPPRRRRPRGRVRPQLDMDRVARICAAALAEPDPRAAARSAKRLLAGPKDHANDTVGAAFAVARAVVEDEKHLNEWSSDWCSNNRGTIARWLRSCEVRIDNDKHQVKLTTTVKGLYVDEVTWKLAAETGRRSTISGCRHRVLRPMGQVLSRVTFGHLPGANDLHLDLARLKIIIQAKGWRDPDRDKLLTLLNIYTTQFGSYATLLWQVPALGLAAQAFLMTIALGSPVSDNARVAAAALSIIIAWASWKLMHSQRGRAINQAELVRRVSSKLSLKEFLGDDFALDDGVPKETNARNVWEVDHGIYHLWRDCMFIFGAVDIVVIISVVWGFMFFSTSSTASSTPKASPSASSSMTASEHAVAADWVAFFSAKTPDARRVRLLQGGSTFAAVIKAQSSSSLAKEATAEVNKVTMVSPTQADVTYSILLSGKTALSGQKGVAVYKDGTWQVGVASFCGLLATENGGSTSGLPAACKQSASDFSFLLHHRAEPPQSGHLINNPRVIY